MILRELNSLLERGGGDIVSKIIWAACIYDIKYILKLYSKVVISDKDYEPTIIHQFLNQKC